MQGYDAGLNLLVCSIFYMVRITDDIFIIVDFDNKRASHAVLLKDRCKVSNKQNIDHKVKRIRSEVIHVFFVG